MGLNGYAFKRTMSYIREGGQNTFAELINVTRTRENGNSRIFFVIERTGNPLCNRHLCRMEEAER